MSICTRSSKYHWQATEKPQEPGPGHSQRTIVLKGVEITCQSTRWQHIDNAVKTRSKVTRFKSTKLTGLLSLLTILTRNSLGSVILAPPLGQPEGFSLEKESQNPNFSTVSTVRGLNIIRFKNPKAGLQKK